MLCLPAKATLLRPSEVEGFKDFFGDGVVRDLGELILKINFIIFN
jgi:hypothetical protein